MFCGIKSYNTCLNAVFRHWHTAPQSFCHRLLSCRWCVVRSRPRNPLLRCVNSLLLLWKPIWTFFVIVNWWSYVICSSPVFLDTLYISYLLLISLRMALNSLLVICAHVSLKITHLSNSRHMIACLIYIFLCFCWTQFSVSMHACAVFVTVVVQCVVNKICFYFSVRVEN